MIEYMCRSMRRIGNYVYLSSLFDRFLRFHWGASWFLLRFSGAFKCFFPTFSMVNSPGDIGPEFWTKIAFLFNSGNLVGLPTLSRYIDERMKRNRKKCSKQGFFSEDFT